MFVQDLSDFSFVDFGALVGDSDPFHELLKGELGVCKVNQDGVALSRQVYLFFRVFPHLHEWEGQPLAEESLLELPPVDAGDKHQQVVSWEHFKLNY